MKAAAKPISPAAATITGPEGISSPPRLASPGSADDDERRFPPHHVAAEQHDEERGRKLAGVERRQCRIEQIGPADGVQVVRQERVAAEIQRADAAHACSRAAMCGGCASPATSAPARARAAAARAACKPAPAKRSPAPARPQHEAGLPASAHQRQHERDGEARRQRLADQQAVGIDRGGERHARRRTSFPPASAAPAASPPRRRPSPRSSRTASAPTGRRRAAPKAIATSSDPGDHGPARADPCDQQRARHGGDAEQQHRQAR